jgi:hypothetical protein
MWFESIFLLAAAGGEMRSNYFKNTAPRRKNQRVLVRLASLGGPVPLACNFLSGGHYTKKFGLTSNKILNPISEFL